MFFFNVASHSGPAIMEGADRIRPQHLSCFVIQQRNCSRAAGVSRRPYDTGCSSWFRDGRNGKERQAT